MDVSKKQEAEFKKNRTIELVKKHPLWTRKQVQVQLRKEFGSGLRYEVYGRLRGDILSAGAIGEYRRRELVKLGFLPSEARALAGVALTSPLMKKYISERQLVLKTAKEVGMPKKALSAQIRYQYKAEGFYKKKKLQPLKRLVAWTRQKYTLEEAAVVDRLGAGAVREWMPRVKRRVYNRWLNAGFMRFEALEFMKAKNWLKLVDSSPGLAARRERSRWVKNLRRLGWTKGRIKKELNAYYTRKAGRSAFDFIRKYRPKIKKDFRIYARAGEERAKELTKNIGKFYRRVLARVR